MPSAAGLYYFAHGIENEHRPPVLLLHGAGGTHLHWPPEVRRLNGQRIFALDLPGHGKSDGIGFQSVVDYAQSIAAFIRALKLPPVILVGHSMGGAIALMLALRFPKRVRGLALVGSGARLRVSPAILESASNPATFPTAVQTVINLAFGPQAEARLKELAAERMLATRSSVLHGDFLACDAFDVMEKVNRIKAPTLVLCGSEDKMTPVRYSEFFHETIEESQLHIIPGAGHMVMLEEPQAVAQILLDFLNTFPDLEPFANPKNPD